MPQAIGDPREIRVFAAQLKKFSAELKGGVSTTKGKLGSLGNTWRDQEHHKFVEKFNASISPVRRLAEEMERYSQFLERKARKLEEYLNQR